MPFRSDANLDPSQVEDRRRTGRNVAIGGGAAGGIGLIIALVLTLVGGGNGSGSSNIVDILNQLNRLNRVQTTGGPPKGTELSQCKTGADAERAEDCRILGYINSIQRYWSTAVDGYTVVPTV